MKRFIGAAAVAGIAIFGGAGALDDNTTRNDSGEIVQSGGLGAFAVQIGDCVQMPDADLIQSFEAVPCNEPHDAQAFYSTDMVLSPPYDEDAVIAEADQICLREFENFTGEAYQDSPYYSNYLYPSQESFELRDDRQALCFITAAPGEKLTTDLRN